MRLVAIGGVVTLLSVFALRHAFHYDGTSYRELCDVVSTSPDDRFQIETWERQSLDPVERALDPISHFGSCDGDGFIVMRERATGEVLAETESTSLWVFRRSNRDQVRWQPRAAAIENPYNTTEITLELPASLASIDIPPDGWKCSVIDTSPDAAYRLEGWSHYKGQGCLQSRGDLRLVDQRTDRVIGTVPTDEVGRSFGQVGWLAHHVELDVVRDGQMTRERLSLD